jgi:hypothetical protein
MLYVVCCMLLYAVVVWCVCSCCVLPVVAINVVLRTREWFIV